MDSTKNNMSKGKVLLFKRIAKTSNPAEALETPEEIKEALVLVVARVFLFIALGFLMALALIVFTL